VGLKKWKGLKMGIVIEPLEILALKKLTLICGAVGESLKDRSAAMEQRALTRTLIDVIHRAEIDNARAKATVEGAKTPTQNPSPQPDRHGVVR
jgi:uncharacterized protein YunC (DUF1805 family)